MTAPDAKTAPLHLRVFLASPSDVSEERKLAQHLLEELACTQAFRGLVTLEVFRYDDERARLGLPLNVTPQQGITRAGFRPADCDFVVAFLWARLGTPLPASEARSDGRPYASGTEWEIEDALSADKEVYLYVRKQPPEFLQLSAANTGAHDDDRAQYARLQEFLGRFCGADGAQAGAILRYSDPSELRDIFVQHMSGVLRRRLDLARHHRETKRFWRIGALGLASIAALSAGSYVAQRVFLDRPNVTIDQVERCDLVPEGSNAFLSFQYSFEVTHQHLGDAAYLEVAEDSSFAPPLLSYKQDRFFAQKSVFWDSWAKQSAWKGWLRVAVRDAQLKLRSKSPVVALDCKVTKD